MSHGRINRVSHPYSATASEQARERASRNQNISICVLIRPGHRPSRTRIGTECAWPRSNANLKGANDSSKRCKMSGTGLGKGAGFRVFLPPRRRNLRLVSRRGHLLVHNTRKGHESPATAAEFALNLAGFCCDSAASRDENQQVNTHSLTHTLTPGEGSGGGEGCQPAELLCCRPSVLG
jgi:hypothetical protein